MSTISTIGLQLQAIANLNSQQTTLGTLNEELASGTLHDNLTDYDPTTAKNLMDFQNAVTQNQSYIAGMNTVNTRLTLYNSTMGDMENIASQAQALASSNQTLDSSTVSQLQVQATNYLKQLTDDLNQQIGGRYIYSGTRYTTPPVSDLSTSTTAPAIPFTATTSPALPSYDSQYSALTINGTPSGNFQVATTSGTTTTTTDLSWSQVESGNVTSVTVNGVSTPVTVTGLTSPATTPAEIASNLQSALSQISSQISNLSGVAATVNGATVAITSSNTAANITADSGGTSGQTTWSSGTDGTTAQTVADSGGAYTKDSVAIDSATSITYGVTSNDPAIQQLIAGLQFMSAATQPGATAATYKTDMAQAASLLTTALSGVQALNAGVASDQNIIANETSTQNADITNLQNQLTNLQAVNITQVGTELDSLQTQLQASYSATASLTQLSILKYL